MANRCRPRPRSQRLLERLVCRVVEPLLAQSTDDRLEARMVAEGLDCVQLRVDRVIELAELEKYTRTLTRVADVPGLVARSSSYGN